jgi:hypothetical protein
MLPIGQGRLNYFAFPIMAFFFIEGLWWLRVQRSRLLGYASTGLIISILMYGYIHIGLEYYKDLSGKSVKFNQYVYNCIGKALVNAKKNNAALVVYEHTHLYHHRLIAITHPEYKVNAPVDVSILADKKEVCKHPELKSRDVFVFVGPGSNDYSPLTFDDICSGQTL